MPHIQAFRGERYNLGHVGALSDVIAPPYDVINSELQDELYKKHPANADPFGSWNRSSLYGASLDHPLPIFLFFQFFS